MTRSTKKTTSLPLWIYLYPFFECLVDRDNEQNKHNPYVNNVNDNEQYSDCSSLIFFPYFVHVVDCCDLLVIF